MSIVAIGSGVLLAACSSSNSTPSGVVHTNPVSTASLPGPKAEVVDGVPLVPITRAQRADCVKFADELKRQVPCPGLLPDPIPVTSALTAASCLGKPGETECGPASILVQSGRFELTQANFEVPPTYIGVTMEQYSGAVVPVSSVSGGPLGHFVITAGVGKLQAVPAYCTPIQVASPVLVHGAIAKLYQCSSSASGPDVNQLIKGHDLLVWDASGITTEVSFHGHSQVNVDLDIAVAIATQLVSPTRG